MRAVKLDDGQNLRAGTGDADISARKVAPSPSFSIMPPVLAHKPLPDNLTPQLAQRIIVEEDVKGTNGKVDDYLVFQSGVRRLTGIDLSYYKRRQMERRIRAFAVRQGIVGADLGLYLELIKRDREQLDLFLDRMTINVSQLWRNPDHFETLLRDVFPLLAQRRGNGSVTFWSAGCSYGAEAYTLAAMCVDNADLVGPSPQVIGTDIDARMVEDAKRGWFSADDARSAPPELLKRHFVARDDGWQANDELLKIVSFKAENLFEAAPPRCDVIVCRNTAIYFTEDARNDLHTIFANGLKAGGFLMVGATELVSTPREIGFERAFPFIYQKAAA